MPSVRRLFTVAVLGLFLLGACGLKLSGEPDIVSQQEIGAPPTHPSTQAVTPAPPGSTEEPAPGEQVAADFNAGMQIYLAQCASCHGAQEGVGPSLADMKDVAASRVEGKSAEEYLRESILDPSAYVVPGYEDIMPKTFGEQLTVSDVDSLVQFIMDFSPEAMMAAASIAQPNPARQLACPVGVTGSADRGATDQGTPMVSDPRRVELNLIARRARQVVSEFTDQCRKRQRFKMCRAPSAICISCGRTDGVGRR
jgi:mono/diheme cytochrome c family protein